MGWRAFSLILVLSTTTVGCKGLVKAILKEVMQETESSSSSPSDEADLSGPTQVIQVEWVEPTKFQVPGEPEQYGTVSVYEGTYQVTLHGMQKGSEFTADGKTTKVDSKVYDIIKLKDMKPLFGQLKIEELNRVTLDPKLTAELRLPGKRAEFSLPPARVLGLDDILEKVENSPVLFEGEPEKTGEAFAILSMTGVRPEVYGKATLLQDIDGIALNRKLEKVKGTKTCGGYKDKNKKPMPDITLRLKETEVVVYDRRTSDIVAKKIFPPDGDCPMFTFSRDDDNSTDSSTPFREIKEWLRSQAKR